MSLTPLTPYLMLSDINSRKLSFTVHAAHVQETRIHTAQNVGWEIAVEEICSRIGDSINRMLMSVGTVNMGWMQLSGQTSHIRNPVTKALTDRNFQLLHLLSNAAFRCLLYLQA
jgi:hypothetical protein